MARKQKFIPNSLKKYRRLMGFSQRDVMLKLGLKSTSMISRWERGLTMPNADNLLKLSTLYKALVNELYYDHLKDIQAELFPEEREIIKPRNKSKKQSNRDP